MNLRPMRLIEYLGHTGWDNGFHSQELVDVCLKMGWAVTLIEREPISLNPVSDKITKITFGDRSAEQRFFDCIWNQQGVLTGTNKVGIPHAVAWEHNRIWDPATGACYSHIEADLGVNASPEPRFSAWNFLRMDRIL
jgi:hypothetical protein